MDRRLDESVAGSYPSKSQKARVLSEAWFERNMFCPRCGNEHLNLFANNQPVADFFCPACGNQHELKSKRGRFGAKVVDGVYETMIQRIISNENPDFFFLSYSLTPMQVNNLFLIPKYFFTPDIIEKRNPLSPNARRAGWVGCSIAIERIPTQGRIQIIRDGEMEQRECILKNVRFSQKFQTDDLASRGWLMDILDCVNRMPNEEFTLEAIYQFETALLAKHPENHNIRPKIRQQLQVLRDKELIAFLGSGRYRKIMPLYQGSMLMR